MTLKRTICPKCGYEQTETDECLRCGVIISKFTDIHKRTESDQRSGLKKASTSAVKNSSAKWVVRAVILSIVILLALGFYLDWWMEDTSILNSTVLGYCRSATVTLLGGYDDTCCGEDRRTFWELDQHTRSEIDKMLQGLIPPEDIRHLGFLIVKDLRISKDNKIPILICKTPLEDIRKEKGIPAKNYIAGIADGWCGWWPPKEYMSLDKSLYIDIEILIKELQDIKRSKNS